MAMTSWSTTAASNATVGTINWAENQAPSTVNGSARQVMAEIKAEWYQAADISSSSTVSIGAAVGGYMKILGTTTITAFDTVDKGIRRRLEFAGALILTHNGTSLILPGGANITTVAGDVAEFVSEGSGNWRCTQYLRNVVPYTEGTWTPADGSGDSLSFTITGAYYKRMGNFVHATANIIVETTTKSATAVLSGLPVTALSGPYPASVVLTDASLGHTVVAYADSGSTNLKVANAENAVGVKNSQLSGKTLYINATYFA